MSMRGTAARHSFQIEKEVHTMKTIKTIAKYSITDEDIRIDIENTVREQEEDSQVSFPDEAARAEFIDDCVESTIYSFEIYEHYCPDYDSIVLDTAGIYGYLS